VDCGQFTVLATTIAHSNLTGLESIVIDIGHGRGTNWNFVRNVEIKAGKAVSPGTPFMVNNKLKYQDTTQGEHLYSPARSSPNPALSRETDRG
jgi:hypothetical protein